VSATDSMPPPAGRKAQALDLAAPTRVVHCKRDRYDVYIRRPKLVAALDELRGRSWVAGVRRSRVTRRLGQAHPFGSEEHLT